MTGIDLKFTLYDIEVVFFFLKKVDVLNELCKYINTFYWAYFISLKIFEFNLLRNQHIFDSKKITVLL
jgi:hypothetical protein